MDSQCILLKPLGHGFPLLLRIRRTLKRRPLMIMAPILAISLLTVAGFATSVSVFRLNLAAKSGVFIHGYFENVAGPGSSTPATNTALVQSGSGGSYSVRAGTKAYLWSPQFSSATALSSGNWRVDLWSSTIRYVPLTITNGQSSATPATFQEKISWNPSSYTSYEAADLGNVRFCSDNGCATQLFAWLESCIPSCSPSATSATAWVKLTSSIPGGGGILTIYMAFPPTSTKFDGSFWGEAPTLSSSYGLYDNGALVFTFYDNFAGTSLSPKWTSIIGSSGASITVNNGLTVTTTSTGTNAYAFVESANQPFPAVAETYTTSGNSILGVATTKSLNGFVAPFTGYSMDWYAGSDDLEYEASGGSTQVNTITQAAFPSGVWQVTWSATASEYFADGAGNTYTGTYSGAAIANYGIYVGQSNGVIASSIFQWARMRAYPPGNVIPSTSFGGITSSSASMTISIYITDSSGTIQSTIASNINSPSVGTSATQYVIDFAGAGVSVQMNGYIEVLISATSAYDVIYWGDGQPTNFQVP